MFGRDEFIGIVENRFDPLDAGRCQVRIVGLHTQDKTILPTEDLPWAHVMMPANSASVSGIGTAPVGVVEGTVVIVKFIDYDQQMPIIYGTLGGESISQVTGSDISSFYVIGNAAKKPSDIQFKTNSVSSGSKTITFSDGGDLTQSIKPDYQISGEGIPYGTTVTTVTSSSITLSNPVSSNINGAVPVFAAPATNSVEVKESTLKSNYVDTDNGSKTPTMTPDENAVNKQIPNVPPKGSTSNVTKATASINALLAAADKVGLTTKEQKCALLALCGGETRWIPTNENYNYSPSRLQEIFKFCTPSIIDKYSRASRKGMSRYEFFSFFYGPTTRGRKFNGNLTDDDGGKFFGRGLIQLTGRGNYEYIQRKADKLGIDMDILNNPDSANQIDVAAYVAAIYVKYRTSSKVSPSAHPGYFYAAKRGVGNNSDDIAAIKLKYYEYFYGASASGYVEKSAAEPYYEPASAFDGRPAPDSSSSAVSSQKNGFRDPNSKYPLKGYENEPTTNRLARGVAEGTAYSVKLATRHTNIPLPNGQGTWNQVKPVYGAVYPHNQVTETESGHIIEYDNTPNYERISHFHRSGTYSEIGPNGSQTNYIVGDNYTIIDNNGYVHVSGAINITVDGNTNIYARSDANIEVDGNTTLNIGKDLNANILGDFNLSVGGNWNTSVFGDVTLGCEDYTQSTLGSNNLKAMSIAVEAQTGYNLTSDNILNITSKGGMNLHDSKEVNIESAGKLSLLSSGMTAMGYSTLRLSDGGQGYANNAATASLPYRPSQGKNSIFADSSDAGTELSDLSVWGDAENTFVPIKAPTLNNPLYVVKSQLAAPSANYEPNYETESDWNTPSAKREVSIMQTTQGSVNAMQQLGVDPTAISDTGLPLTISTSGLEDFLDSTTSTITNTLSVIGNSEVSGFLNKITSSISSVMSSIGAKLSDIAAAVKLGITNGFNTVGEYVETIVDSIETSVTSLVSKLQTGSNTSYASKLLKVIEVSVKNAGDNIGLTFSIIKSIIENAIESVTMSITSIVSKVKDIYDKIVNTDYAELINNQIESITNSIKGEYTTIIKNIQSIYSALKEEFESDIGTVKKFYATITGNGIEVDDTIIKNTKTFTKDFRISKNFTLGMIINGLGSKNVLKDQSVNGITLTKQDIVKNLANLVNNCLEPLITNNILPDGMNGYNKKWKILSSYRSQTSLSDSVSPHCSGLALDIALIGGDFIEKSENTFELIQNICTQVKYKELNLIYQYQDSVWIHLSYDINSRNTIGTGTMVNNKKLSDGFVLVTNIPPYESKQ